MVHEGVAALSVSWVSCKVFLFLRYPPSFFFVRVFSDGWPISIRPQGVHDVIHIHAEERRDIMQEESDSSLNRPVAGAVFILQTAVNPV